LTRLLFGLQLTRPLFQSDNSIEPNNALCFSTGISALLFAISFFKAYASVLL